MKNKIGLVLTVFVFICGSIPSWAQSKKSNPNKSHQGYKRHMASTYVIYEGTLQRFFDEGPNFFIQIEGQAGLYRFPKSEDNATDVKKFLTEKLAQKKKIKLEVNTHNAEITTLTD